jgi:hypothetical protein
MPNRLLRRPRRSRPSVYGTRGRWRCGSADSDNDEDMDDRRRQHGRAPRSGHGPLWGSAQSGHVLALDTYLASPSPIRPSRQVRRANPATARRARHVQALGGLFTASQPIDGPEFDGGDEPQRQRRSLNLAARSRRRSVNNSGERASEAARASTVRRRGRSFAW